jgi:hypothetical protein
MGSSDTRRASTDWLAEPLVVSSNGASEVTVMVSCTSPSSNVTLISIVSLILIVTPSRKYFLKPAASTAI